MDVENPPSPPRQRRTTAHLGLATAVVAGAAAALLFTYPLILHLSEAIPGRSADCDADQLRCRDDVLLAWIAGEGGRRLYTDPLHLFEAKVFYPLKHVLAYSESMLSAGAFVAPLNAFSGNPVLGYNLYVLASLTLCCVGLFLLVRRITGLPLAGLVAGVFAVLSADRWGMHVAAQSIHFAPLLLFAWLRYLDEPSRRRALGLGALLVLHVHSSAYHALMLPVACLGWSAVLIAARTHPLRHWLRSFAVLGCAALPALAVFAPYLEVRDEIAYQPNVLLPVYPVWFLGAFGDPLAYLQGLAARNPGMASPLPLVLLTLAGVVAQLRRSRVPAPPGAAAHILAALAFTAVAIGVSLVSGPFEALYELPGFSSMRTTTRFRLLATLGGALLLGMAAAILLRRLRRPAFRVALATALLAAVAVDSRVLTQPHPLIHLGRPDEVPAVYRWLASTPADTAVLELPLGSWETDVLAMFYSLHHRRPLVNGYSATMPVWGTLGGFPSAESLRPLREAGVRYVIVHADVLREHGREHRVRRLEARKDLTPEWIGNALVLEVPDGAPAPPARLGPPLPRDGWRLIGSEPGAERAADGDLATHWTANLKAGEGRLKVDLGDAHTVTGVTLRIGQHIRESAPRIALRASLDGEQWIELRGPTELPPPFASYRRDHRDIETTLDLAPFRARWLELRVTRRPLHWQHTWGVHELVIHGPLEVDG